MDNNTGEHVDVHVRTRSMGRRELYDFRVRFGSIERGETYLCETPTQAMGSMAQFMRNVHDHPELQNKPVILRLPRGIGMERGALEQAAKDAFQGEMTVM
jgi:hypothetical protein